MEVELYIYITLYNMENGIYIYIQIAWKWNYVYIYIHSGSCFFNMRHSSPMFSWDVGSDPHAPGRRPPRRLMRWAGEVENGCTCS
jgi:hypothetical protein